MDQKELRELEKKCIQEEPPECAAACPIHVNVREFMRRMQDQKWADAFRILQKTMPFPGILGRICGAPCMERCKAGKISDPVHIGELERVCVQKSAPRLKIPPIMPKEQRTAVIGGGLSGLTAALDLAKKGYAVTIYEPEAAAGAVLAGRYPERLTPEIVAEELQILVRLNVQIETSVQEMTAAFFRDILKAYDAAYLDLETAPTDLEGLERDDAGRVVTTPKLQSTSVKGVFAGGDSEKSAQSPVWKVAEGRWAAATMDRYLQNVSWTAGREKEGPFATRLHTRIEGIDLLPQTVMADPVQGYTDEEAVQEANRCILCECRECVSVCLYLERFGSYPKRYAREIYNNESIVMGSRKANKLINSCSLCGLCEAVCPERFSMPDLCLTARRSMVERGKMPPSAHEFALLDMAFSRSEKFAFHRHEPGFSTSEYLFFPGCQLCASSPGQTEAIYGYLRTVVTAGAGLMFDCCGAPAYWAGRETVFREILERFESVWAGMGRPAVITACSTCHRMFSEHLPAIPLTSLWRLMAEKGAPGGVPNRPAGAVWIHDPCTTRHEPEIRESVRKILRDLTIDVEEPALSGEKTECCGFGGLMQTANPALAREIVRQRANISRNDYITYCAMCRDNLASAGKRTLHLADLFFPEWPGEDPAIRKSPGWSDRRENRERLRVRLLTSVWNETVPGNSGAHRSVCLIIPETISEMLDERRILEEDIQKTIHHAETTSMKFHNPNTGRYLASFKPYKAIFWVEYTMDSGGYVIHNAYAHRMETFSV